MTRSFVALLLVLSGGAALGQGADVALVNLVSGDVTYLPHAGKPGKVQPYMKVRDGDRINIAPGGQVRIVFFDSARQELWVGPASFRAGRTEAVPITGKVVETTSLPIGVPQRLAQIPEIVQYSRIGGNQIRGILTPRQEASLEQQAALSKARAVYQDMRKNMPADDITPELYLYAALYEFLVYDEMKMVVAEMQRKQPNNEDVRALETWLTTRAPR